MQKRKRKRKYAVGINSNNNNKKKGKSIKSSENMYVIFVFRNDGYTIGIIIATLCFMLLL